LRKTRANQSSSMILTLNNIFIACISISNYNISYSNHIVHTYLYVDESIRSELCNLALIPYVTCPQLWVVWTSSKFDVLLLLHLRTRTMLVQKFCKIFLWSMSNPVFVISKLHSWYNSHFKVCCLLWGSFLSLKQHKSQLLLHPFHHCYW